MSNITTTNTSAYGVQAYAQNLTRPQGQRGGAPWQQSSSATAAGQSEDHVTLSKKGRELSTGQEAAVTSDHKGKKSTDLRQADTKGSDQESLNEVELRQVQQLKQRDTEVRTHEQAHLSTAGQYAAGGPSFSYQTGPNGKRYAVGGSVPIDMKEASTPAATMMKMRTVKRAALAPANPSAADRQIAARASMQEMKAMQELQTAQMTASNTSSPASSDQEKSESPDNFATGNAPKTPDSETHIQEPSKATRAIMSAAYKAMASFA